MRLGKGGWKEVKDHPWLKPLYANKILKKQVKSPFIPEFQESNLLLNFDKNVTSGEALQTMA